MEQLLLEVDGSSGMLGIPFMLIQPYLCDATGIAQFINAVAELARGLPAPTVAPTWFRELLEGASPPTPSFPLSEFDVQQPVPLHVYGDMVVRSFTFGPSEVAAIKKRLPPLLGDTATTFEALAAFLWRARSAALEVPPGEDAPLAIMVNFRAAASKTL
ncbi:hypothetical protein QYE76_046927 [Lolium multiflorum]|uniref:Uncharacterized protein n=1 Tax=Lolium multiflorum TaxID=4521 RepID=A0AAD8TMX4_LOLMU|nr:hypothetical protein QYE76_046927 [Lolium multiflorum]